MSSKLGDLPAFPGIIGSHGSGNSIPIFRPDGSQTVVITSEGITIRQHITIEMAKAIISAGKGYTEDVVASGAVKMADALLRVL